METLENILAGKALLGHGVDPTTSLVRELLPPPSLSDDATTDQQVDTDLRIFWPDRERYAGVTADLSSRVELHGETAMSTQLAKRVLHWFRKYSRQATTSKPSDVYVVATSYASVRIIGNYAFVSAHDLGSQWSEASLHEAPHQSDPLSPFERVEQRRYLQIRLLIDGVGTTYKVPHASALKDRLIDLARHWMEEHQAGNSPSPESLSGLLRFLSSEKEVRMPSIMLSPEGTWVAEWRLNTKNMFSAHFLDEANARFVVVAALAKPSRRLPNRAWGEIEIGRLLPTARAYGAEKWICNEGRTASA